MSSLLPKDLEKMVLPTFGVDIFDAKTGDNTDVSVLSFRVRSESAAKDLSKFVEKEGDWIMDSDISTGEDDTGHFLTFVEIKRNNRLADRIQDLLEIIERLTEALDWQFTVGKRVVAYPANRENLEKMVPMNVDNFNKSVNEQKYERMVEFFDSTQFNTISVNENIVELQQFFQEFKPHSSLRLQVVLEDPEQDQIDETVSGTTNKHYRWLEKLMGEDITVEARGSSYILTNNKLNRRLLVNINE